MLVYWVGLGFSEGPGREPTTPRYLFFGSIMVLLIAAARAQSAKPTRAALAVLLGFCCVSLIFNVSQLVRTADSIRAAAGDVRAQLGALELAGDRAVSAFVPRVAGPPASTYLAVDAGGYQEFARSIGSLGLTGAEISAQPQDVRAGADFVLARAQGLAAGLPQRAPPGAAPCEPRRIPAGDRARFALQPGTTFLRLLGTATPEPLLVGRFAPPSVPVGAVAPESFTRIDLAEDGVSEPWIAQVEASVEICRLPLTDEDYQVEKPPVRAPERRPNVVTIVTDDQTLESFNDAVMPNTVELLAERGTTFSEAIVSTPQCCPSRAGYLTGQYSQNNGVTSNDPGYPLLLDKPNVLPSWLQAAGYDTIHIGKYLNGYFGTEGLTPGPGWDSWRTLVSANYQNSAWSIDGELATFPGTYLTTKLNEFATEAIRGRADSSRPFYLQVDHLAPTRDRVTSSANAEAGPFPMLPTAAPSRRHALRVTRPRASRI